MGLSVLLLLATLGTTAEIEGAGPLPALDSRRTEAHVNDSGPDPRPPPPPPPPPECPPPPNHLSSWPSAADLEEFNRWMANLGPRFAGTPAHECLLAGIREALDPLVNLGKLDAEFIPARKHAAQNPGKFINWQATSWKLQLGNDPPQEASGYFPYSGLTSTGPVTGEVVFERPAFWKRLLPAPLSLRFPFEFELEHEGKIVAVWIPSVKLPKWFLKYLSRNDRSDFDHWWPYERSLALELQAPCPNKAAKVGQTGVKGIVAILDMPPEHAEKQYLPFTRPVHTPIGEGVPAVYVDRTLRSKIRDLAKAGGSATITVQGSNDPATSEHLIYTLPGKHSGDPSQDEIILVQTHTDGPSALEENGIMALVAMAHRFAAVPISERRRTMKFLFATGHFVREIEGATDLVQGPDAPWLGRTRAAVSIEHLGTKEWVDDPKGPDAGYRVRKTAEGDERDEPALLFVTGGGHPLEKLADDTLPQSRRVTFPSRERMMLLKRKFFGEGQYVACTGIPTVGYAPNPNYMFSFADPGGANARGHFEKLDSARTKRELDAFWTLTSILVKTTLSEWPQVAVDATHCTEPETACD